MIICRTPFRVSFFGGGTDYPVYYEKNSGAVLSTTINKYCYVTCRYLPPFFDYKYIVTYKRREETQTISEIQHPTVRECLNYVPLNRGVAVHYDADLPAMSGLGTSSAFTVGLLNALYALKGEMKTKRQLALDAIHIEQDKVGDNVGSQDQTASAFGGLNRIDFGGPQKIIVHPITVVQNRIELLQSHLMLFFTGFSRVASEIAEEQIRKTSEKKSELKRMYEMVDEAVGILSMGDLKDFGKLMHEGWMIKKSLTSKITTPLIDEVYKGGLEAGALGGKLLGAGSGGFMLFFVQPELQRNVRNKLSKLLNVPFKFENLGSQIIYYAPEENF